MNLEKINLSRDTKKHLISIGYDKLTEIQEKIIPIVLEGRDAIGQSHTGTGKTASFLIPILEKMQKSSSPQALILVPTRELALQVSREAKKLLPKKSRLNVLAVFGGTSIQKQIFLLRNGIDIVIGTVGRIVDHINRNTFLTNQLKFVVLDEADEMIKQGFLEDITKIIKHLPRKRQTLLFSATITSQIKDFSQEYLKETIHIISKDNEPQIDNISQYYVETNYKNKKPLLLKFIQSNNIKSSIIFSNTKKEVELIKQFLEKNKIPSDFIHSGLTQKSRIRILDKFKKKEINLLIATDVIARGIDVKGIDYVINYDLPQDIDFYIHRIGRTGRMGSKGKALIFTNSSKEKQQLAKICKEKKYKIEKLSNLKF